MINLPRPGGAHIFKVGGASLRVTGTDWSRRIEGSRKDVFKKRLYLDQGRLSQSLMGGDYYSLLNMRKSRPREVKAFLQGHTASNQWDSNLDQYDSKALNHNLILPETFLDSDSAIRCTLMTCQICATSTRS